MVTYRLILKNEKRKFYKSFSVFILVMNALAICLFLYYLPQTTAQQVTGIIAAVLAISVIVYREKMVGRRHTDTGIYEVMVALAVYWAFIGYWWVAAGVIALAILYRIANRAPEVKITDHHIIYPSFPGRTIQWDTLNNVVLKDGLLTIDFRDNKLIQQLLDPSAIVSNEHEINEFCRERLKKD
ncbi:MAG: hypothetical protein ABWZ25_03505 [Chitinophagaceae bacterium]